MNTNCICVFFYILELLERVLLRFGCADTDEKLEAAIKKFLAPVLIKIETPHQAVKNKVTNTRILNFEFT